MTVYFCRECNKHEFIDDGKDRYLSYICGCGEFVETMQEILSLLDNDFKGVY